MVCQGHIENGVIVLDEPLTIPDGVAVRVEFPGRKGRTLAERLAPVIGIIDGMPEDAAENHDHYLYGVPKR
jgi:hypothetical protein